MILGPLNRPRCVIVVVDRRSVSTSMSKGFVLLVTKRTVFAIDFESTVLPSNMTRDGKITFLYRPVQVSSVDPSS